MLYVTNNERMKMSEIAMKREWNICRVLEAELKRAWHGKKTINEGRECKKYQTDAVSESTQ
jgi:hypothetical protein